MSCSPMPTVASVDPDGSGEPTAAPAPSREPARRPAPAPTGVDALVDATPASRDRVVDLLRAASIAVAGT